MIYGKYKCSKDVRKDPLQAFKTKNCLELQHFISLNDSKKESGKCVRTLEL